MRFEPPDSHIRVSGFLPIGRTTRSPARPHMQPATRSYGEPYESSQTAVSGAAAGSARETTNHANDICVLITSSHHQLRSRWLDFQADTHSNAPRQLGDPQCPDSNCADTTVYALEVSPCLEPPWRTTQDFTTVALTARTDHTNCRPNEGETSHLEPPLHRQPPTATAHRHWAASDTNHLVG